MLTAVAAQLKIGSVSQPLLTMGGVVEGFVVEELFQSNVNQAA